MGVVGVVSGDVLVLRETEVGVSPLHQINGVQDGHSQAPIKLHISHGEVVSKSSVVQAVPFLSSQSSEVLVVDGGDGGLHLSAGPDWVSQPHLAHPRVSRDELQERSLGQTASPGLPGLDVTLDCHLPTGRQSSGQNVVGADHQGGLHSLGDGISKVHTQEVSP